MNSQEEDGSEWQSLTGTTSIDWFETGACVQWNRDESEGWFQLFNDAKAEAQNRRKPMPVRIGSHFVCVHGSGHGGGRGSHKEITLVWKDSRIGLSHREKATRQLSNASLIVSGQPCLITGWSACWEFFRNLIETIGGRLTDEWVRRVDVCIDIPGLSFGDNVYPLLRNRQFVTTCSDVSFSESQGRPTGMSAGKLPRLKITVYDKLIECMEKKDPAYRAAMIQRRWDDVTPDSATRVEWQIGREWLTQYGLDTSKQTMYHFPEIFAKLTAERRGHFRMTDKVPDRRWNHQSRTGTHPLWKRVIQIGEDTIGAAETELKRLDRSQLDERRAIAQIVGFGTSIADRGQTICESKADLLRLISDRLDSLNITDDDILNSFMKKAKASGTWDDIFSFPGKESA
jgi:hypothetical protein